MSKVQALPRQSIKSHKYNFADLLGDINYIGDEKLPMFQSRAGGLAQKHSSKGVHGKQISIESGLKQAAESAKNSSLHER